MALIPSGFAGLGAWRDSRLDDWAIPWSFAAGGAAILGGLFIWPLWLAGDEPFSVGDISVGAIAGPVTVAVVPSLFYFGLGRLLADRQRRVLAAAAVVSLFPVGVYMWYTLLLTLDRTLN